MHVLLDIPPKGSDLMETFIEYAPVPMILYKEKVICANTAFKVLFGYDQNELNDMHIWDFIEENFRDEIRRSIQKRLMNDMPNREYQFRMYTHDHQTRWVHLVATTILYKDQYLGFATFFDITEKKRLEDEMILRDQLWTDIFNQHSAIMLLVDPDNGQIVDVNPSASAFYGYTIEQLKQMKICDINILSKPEISDRMQEARNKTLNEFIFQHRLANGKMRHVQVFSSLIHSKGKNVLFSIIHDVTESVLAEQKLREANQILQQISFMDGLTGISNRRTFDEYIQHNWQEGKQLSLIMIDIDHFKNFNDTYGHQKGDDCLKRVARALTLTLRRSHDFVARYGGEEFVVVLSESDEVNTMFVAEQLRHNVESLRIPHSTSHVSQSVTISLGVCPASAAKNIEDLIEKADQALYVAKRNGRNQVVMYEESLLADIGSE